MSSTVPADVEFAAKQYLSEQLGSRAPTELAFVATFDERPLDGEGRATLFSFSLAPGGPASACGAVPTLHYVAAGETVPNYFPAYGLGGDDAYSLHIGTRFMLEMGIARVEESAEPASAREFVKRLVRDRNPEARVGDPRLQMLFRCEDQYFGVYELEVDDERISCVAADCPAGFYRGVDLPPQVLLRLHLGKVIRQEPPPPATLGPST